jgi:hypothetical protein
MTRKGGNVTKNVHKPEREKERERESRLQGRSFYLCMVLLS